MKLFVLANSVWCAGDYLSDRNCNPKYVDLYLFTSEKQCREKALNLYYDFETYNDCTMFVSKEISDKTIEEISGVEISEFKKMLAEPYSSNSNKNWGEDEKEMVAAEIVEDSSLYMYEDSTIDVANYDFDKSLNGSILVFWEWRTHVGYARKCLEVRYADDDETEALLTKQDSTFVSQCDVLLTAEEVRNAKKQKKLYLAVLDELQQDTWKWTNQNYAESQAEQFE